MQKYSKWRRTFGNLKLTTKKWKLKKIDESKSLLKFLPNPRQLYTAAAKKSKGFSMLSLGNGRCRHCYRCNKTILMIRSSSIRSLHKVARTGIRASKDVVRPIPEKTPSPGTSQMAEGIFGIFLLQPNSKISYLL